MALNDEAIARKFRGGDPVLHVVLWGLVDGKILLVYKREISSRPAISSLNNLKMRNSSVCN
jgi:hypothetical protein